jgi:predicted nucleic acid-binding protein
VVAVDSSTVIAYIEGRSGRDIALFENAIISGAVAIPPVVLSELLSEPSLPADHRETILKLEVLDLSPGYWLRAAATRAAVLSHRLRARLPDTLIAQSCIDHDVALITRDRDFRHFVKHCGLKLA